MKRWLWTMLAALAVPAAGCDPSGACVQNYVGYFYYCGNDWDEEDCLDEGHANEAPAPTFHAGETCQDLGFTSYCSENSSYMKPADGCDGFT